MSDIGDKVARQYATALFDCFESQAEQLTALEAALRQLAVVWESDSNVRALLTSSTVVASEKQAALKELGLKLGKAYGVNPAEHLSRFLMLLSDNGRISGLPEVSAAFAQRCREHRGEVQVQVITASELSDDERQEVAAQVTTQVSAKSQIEWHVDPAIIGGVIIRAGDKEIDGSVRGSLAQAKQALATQ